MVLNIYRNAMNYKDDSNPSLGVAIKFLRGIGVWRYGRSRMKTIISYSSMVACFCYMIDLIINLVVNFNFDIGIWFVQYSALHIGLIKMLTIVKNSNSWEDLTNFMANIDIKSTKVQNSKYLSILLKYRKYCTEYSVFYLVISFVINITFISLCMFNNMVLPFLIDNTNMFYAFFAILPFDESTMLGRNLSSVLQVLYFETTVLYVVGWDVFLISLLLFLVGHFKALRIRCVAAVNCQEDCSLKNITECHQQYVDLMTCYSKLNNLVSPLMFLHLLLVTVNLGVCIIVLIYRKDNVTELISVFQLILAILIQMTLCYWLADEVVIQHDAIAYGIFESDWVESTPRVRRLVLLLAVGMNRKIAFSAGPFNEMSRVAIISILKTAYSFYTLFSSRR